jgi:hypothetical protein
MLSFGAMTPLRALMRPVYRWVWSDANRRGRKLLQFAAVEADGGKDIARAAEVTTDPLLRRLFLMHAADEVRHADLFRRRGLALLRGTTGGAGEWSSTDWLAPGERGLDDLRVRRGRDGDLLAFLHLSEKSAAQDFEVYCQVLDRDAPTRAVFEEVLRDEQHHMRYTLAQLSRIAPGRRGWLLWSSRAGRLWRAYLRLASALAGAMGAIILTLQYFVILPPFALLAQRNASRQNRGWIPVAPPLREALRRPF